jgi:hypothetical protein
MNVGEQYGPVCVGRHRANTQRWPKTLPIHNRRTGKPSIPPRDAGETIHRIEHTDLPVQAQHACIVRSNVDGVSNSHTARELELTRSHRCPFAAWGPPAQRVLADNGEGAAPSIWCEPSDGLVRYLLRGSVASNCEQPIAPGCDKYRGFCHGIPSFSQLYHSNLSAPSEVSVLWYAKQSWDPKCKSIGEKLVSRPLPESRVSMSRSFCVKGFCFCLFP